MHSTQKICLSGVMVSACSNATDRGFNLCLGETQDNNIYIDCFSAKHVAFRSEKKD